MAILFYHCFNFVAFAQPSFLCDPVKSILSWLFWRSPLALSEKYETTNLSPFYPQNPATVTVYILENIDNSIAGENYLHLLFKRLRSKDDTFLDF